MGPVKTMAVTILIYAGFTGLSAWSPDWRIFGLLPIFDRAGRWRRICSGSGAGDRGDPSVARTHALGLMQALAAVGTILRPGCSEWSCRIGAGRGLYYIGALPALVAAARFGVCESGESGWTAEGGRPAAGRWCGRSFRRHERTFHRRTLAAPYAVSGPLGLSGIIGLWARFTARS